MDHYSEWMRDKREAFKGQLISKANFLVLILDQKTNQIIVWFLP
jgi:hypothetical protein